MLKKFLLSFFVAVSAFMFFTAVTAAWQPEFKEQDIKEANELCVGKPTEAELVPTEDGKGNFNLALLKNAKSNAESLLPGYPIHQIEHLNDGFYNNCRSWISGITQETWAEIELRDTYSIKKVGIGSDHCGHYQDRAATEFEILVATEYNEDSEASTWDVVYEYDEGEPIHLTIYFEFKEVEARYVRIVVFASNQSEVRIDEIEIYGGPLAINQQSKFTISWGEDKDTILRNILIEDLPKSNNLDS